MTKLALTASFEDGSPFSWFLFPHDYEGAFQLGVDAACYVDWIELHKVIDDGAPAGQIFPGRIEAMLPRLGGQHSIGLPAPIAFSR